MSKKKKESLEDLDPPPTDMWIATICMAADGSLDVDFQGMNYWTFKGIIEEIHAMLIMDRPYIKIANQPDEEVDE
jgi:hypothetical protein